jgi:hypothetical protein
VYTYSNPDTFAPELVILRLKQPTGKTFLQARPEQGGYILKAPSGQLPIYNRARVRDAEEVVVVEGEKCVHALFDVGIVATTSPGGAGKASMADWSLLAGKRVYLWPDNDTKGQDHMRDVVRILEPLNCSLLLVDVAALNLPPKGDVCDYLAANGGTTQDGNTAVRLVMDDAQLLGASKGLQERLELMMSGEWRSIPWPWFHVSTLARALLPGTLTIFPGEAGTAKSFLLLEAMWNWHLQGFKTALYELEEDRTYWLLRALAQLESNSNLTDPDWIKLNPDLTSDSFQTQCGFLDNFGKTIWDAPDKDIPLDALADWVEARAAEGCEIIGVDPVTAAQVSAKPWLDDQKFILRTKRIMRQYNSRLILVTHPRTTRGKEAALNMMAGGAAYERFSQSVLWLRMHQKTQQSSVQTSDGIVNEKYERSIRICKARNGPGGGCEIAFTLNPQTLRFEEKGLIVDEARDSFAYVQPDIDASKVNF